MVLSGRAPDNVPMQPASGGSLPSLVVSAPLQSHSLKAPDQEGPRGLDNQAPHFPRLPSTASSFPTRKVQESDQL